MSVQLAVLLACLIVTLLTWGVMFAIALVAAPKGITTGPTVLTARWLFVVGLVTLVLAVVALVWGLVTSWAA